MTDCPKDHIWILERKPSVRALSELPYLMAGITAEYEGNINIKSGDNQGVTVRNYTAVCGNYYSISRHLYGKKMSSQRQTDNEWKAIADQLSIIRTCTQIPPTRV